MAFSRFIQFNILAGAPATATSMENAVSYDGVTFTFDRPMPVGYFVTGKPFVVSEQAFAITGTSPGSTQIDGAWAHGMMQDPFTPTNTGTQGFDEFLATWITASARTAYGNNIDPGATGADIAVALGQETAFVKAVRRSSVTDNTSWQTIEKYVQLTVLASAPPVGSYMPTASGLTKKLVQQSAIDESVLRALALPGSLPDHETIKARVPSNIGAFGSKGAELRLFRLDRELGVATTNYSADLALAYAQYLGALHDATLSVEDRQEIIDFTIETALQLEGLASRGWGDLAGRNGGAGQQGGVHPWLYYGAFLLQDPAMLATAQAVSSSMDGNSFWVTPEDVGRVVGTQADNSADMTFLDEMVGMPDSNPEDENAHMFANYMSEHSSISSPETLVVEMLQNGPGGVDGTQALLKGGAFDTSNQSAAHIAYMDRVRTWEPRMHLAVASWADGAFRDTYDAVVPVLSRAKWTGVPDILPYGNNAFGSTYDDDMFSANGAGAIAWDIDGRNYATEPVTQYDVRYSLDGVQWVESLDVGSSGSLSGLLRGVEHWCSIRQQSASGAGPWSLNIPSITTDGDPGKVTTTGSATSAAPVNTLTPALHILRYPAWRSQKIWMPASGVLSLDDVDLAAGVGYWSGYPAPVFLYQWQRSDTGTSGWSSISGAINAEYARSAADAQKFLRCRIRASNGVGGTVEEFTNAVQCPALSAVPATTLIDTNFRGRFAIDYEAELAAIITDDCNALHEPVEAIPEIVNEPVNFGGIRCDKTGTRPRFDLPLRNPAVAGASYDITAQIATDWNSGIQFKSTLVFEIINSAETVFFSSTLDPEVSTQREAKTIADTFTIPGGETNLALYARVRGTTTDGGGGGGDPMLMQLSVTQS